MAPPASLPRPPIGKIVCVGRNFRAHARELGNPIPKWPVIFIKPTTTLIGPDEPIILPPQSAEVHHEGEVAVVIGAPLKEATEAEALEAIAGWVLLNDVTARDLQRADKGRFTRAKSFDSFCPITDVMLPELSPEVCRVRCLVNGEVRQDGSLSDWIFSPGEVLAFISAIMTLLPGDVVSLGTPEGVGPIQHGDVVEVELLGEGARWLRLSNPVR